MEAAASRRETGSLGGLGRYECRQFRVAWILAIGLHLAHLVTLPVLITYDGSWYVWLAEIIGRPGFLREWEYLRTPLMPALLRAAFALFGRQPLAATVLLVAWGCAGVLLLSLLVGRVSGPVWAAVVAVVLSAYPTLVVYEHAILSETGSAFFLAATVYALWRHPPTTLGSTCLLIAVLTLGFYHRSSLLALAPACGLVGLLRARYEGDGTTRIGHAPLWGALGVAVVPFVLAYPWQAHPEARRRVGESVIIFGLVRQAALPIGREIPPAAVELYHRAVQDSLVDGRLPLTGLRDGREYPVIGLLSKNADRATTLWFAAVKTRAYWQAFGRTLLVYAGGAISQSENALFRSRLLDPALAGSVVYPGPSGLPDLTADFSQRAAPSLVGVALRGLSPLYDWLVPVAVLSIPLGIVFGAVKRDWALLSIGVLGISYLGANAAVLNSSDRMAVPVYPLAFTSIFLLLAKVRHGRRGAGQTRRPGTAPGGGSVEDTRLSADSSPVRQRPCGLREQMPQPLLEDTAAGLPSRRSSAPQP